MNGEQLAALVDPFNPTSLADAVTQMAARRRVTQHGDGYWSIVCLAVDR